MLIRLDQIYPLGGGAGTTVTLDIRGRDLDGVKSLHFDNPGFKAEFIKANQFKVAIAADVPTGTYEVRAVGTFGISGARLFAVGHGIADVSEVEQLQLETLPSERIKVPRLAAAPIAMECRFRQCLEFGRANNLSLATHLAETLDEEPFLSDHAGPFQEMWQRLGFWDDSVPTFKGSPIEFARSIGLLDYLSLLAHVNYCNDAELDVLASGRASIVYCPRTHAYFSHPPHRWRQTCSSSADRRSA